MGKHVSGYTMTVFLAPFKGASVLGETASAFANLGLDTNGVSLPEVKITVTKVTV